MVWGQSAGRRWWLRTSIVALVTVSIVAGGLVTSRIGAASRATPRELLDDGWVRGNPEARVTMVVFSDFECLFCGQLEPVLLDLLRDHPGDLRIVFRHFPLPQHRLAMLAARAAEAAGDQGKFWEMHDRIFEGQKNLSETDFDRFAHELGLNIDDFSRNIRDSRSFEGVMHDVEAGQRLRLAGVPALFLNGRQLDGPFTSERLSSSIEEELATR